MSKRVVIAGGGTGGHLYPALAIARAIKKIDNHVDVSFVGSKQGIEHKVIPKTEFAIHYITIGRLNSNVSIFERLKTLMLLPFTLIQTLFLFFKLRPQVVFGVGGYVSAPFLFVASFFRVPIIIWEPNAYPGLANRLLASRSSLALLVFEEANKILKAKNCMQVGLPVREEIEQIKMSEEVIGDEGFHVLIFGGSQGARGINKVVSEALLKQEAWQEGVQFIHQIGSTDFEFFNSKYEASNNPNRTHLEFIHDMHKKYKWAHMVVCRAGVGSAAELMAVGLPAVFVPFPNAADNHQFKNAKVLLDKEAALLVEQKDFTPESFRDMVLKLKNDAPLRKKISSNIHRLHVAQSAHKIAQIILD
ncbi:MAG: undecaprenyldiphospho-muramoylpentapeptide beta-N-acetylglucosaminyltransferase [Bdellovibrionaceae bacterium]|jgi:UDP-N-acetylglucosamine--N-acetylmuramyl-(pentapeptide) pyrophosphoryl-undecaprenol N-acetylglucosamine transferase|nr:undecaprenyldiphospho-muramoylpentapeptide beta-N-acetylglucosaminyltransferase [Pseudobdellovibrionaceae bacterium]